MNAVNRSWNLVLSHIGPGKKAVSQIALCILGGLLLSSFKAQAASVTINLGLTAQNLTLAGLGPNANGLGRYNVTMGACTPSAGNTTCVLSGSFTGTTSGLTSGTYSLVTTYVGTGPTPLQGVQQASGSDLFTFSFIPSTTTMTLTLVSSSGTTVVPLFTGGNQFVTGATFGFLYTGSQTCTGPPVSACSVGPVGLVAGAVISGQSVGSASFLLGNNYYISQLAFNGGWQSILTFVNYSPQQVSCTTNFYSDPGNPLPVPFSQGTISTRTDTLPPGGSIHDSTITSAGAAGSVTQGWAEATCTGPVQASLLYRFYNNSGVAAGEASVSAETAPTTEFATFAETRTGVAYANPSTTQSANITFEVYSSTGAQLGTKGITLGPLAHGADTLGHLLGLASFTGFVKITSTSPIISLSLNAEASPVFSSLPPGDLPGSTAMVP